MNLAVCVLATVLSLLLCALLRRRATLDVPNARSAHAAPVATGGGVGIIAGAALSLLLADGLQAWPQPYAQLMGLALMLMLLGWMDDRWGLPVWVRFGVYLGVCSVAVWELLPQQGLWVYAIAVFFCLWMVNLFNFMDGIDGIAATQASFVLLATAGLAWAAGADSHYVVFCGIVSGACLGFLVWNWAPARLFMGDAGSIPLGFLLAAVAVLGAQLGAVPIAASLILVAAFMADASFTLARRLWRGERVTEAHSQHLYQRLARRWRGHASVVLAMLAYNLLWLLPLAATAVRWPSLAAGCVLLAYLPLLPVLLKAGKLP